MTMDTSGGAGGYSANLTASQQVLSFAQNKAQTAYNNARLQLDSDTLAYQKAQAAYQDALNQAQTFGVSPGGSYNGVQLPAAGTPTMGQVAQWGSMYGVGAAPANQYQMTLGAQAQQFQQQQAAQQNYAGLSGYYTPQAGGMLGQGVNIQQIDQALQGALGRDYNQNVFQSMTQNLQGQNLNNAAATQAINSAIQSASQGRLQGLQDIAGALGSGAYQTPAQQQTMQMQAQTAGLTGMTTYQPYTSGTWLYDPNTGTYGQVSDNGQVRNFSDINQAKQAGMPVADWAGGNQVDPARVVQTSSANNWGGIGGQQATTAYQQQLYNQGLSTAQFLAQQQQQQQQNALSYMQLQSQLRGPADYGAYLQTMASTPGGMGDLVRAAAGQYIPGGGTTGVAPTAASLQSLSQQAGVGSPGYTQQQQQPVAGQTTGAPAGGPQAAPTTYSDYMRAANALPNPNQIAPQSFNMMTDTQKQMISGMYQQLGYTPQDVSDLFKGSLPQVAQGQANAGQYRLQ
jgi:hypothetical protein